MSIECLSQSAVRLIYVNKRIFFEYADNPLELCVKKNHAD